MIKLIFYILFMAMKNGRSVDLNLMIIFDAMMAERSVTLAARRVGLTQPSMSNALSRLRGVFEDELFVRTPEGMVPTPVAIKAANHVKMAITAAEEALSAGDRAFAPESAEGTITILTNDFIEFTIIPRIVEALAKEAPKLRVQTNPIVKEAFEHELDARLSDFAIAAPVEVPKRFDYAVLFEEPFFGIARLGHPLLSGPITADRFFTFKHVAVSHRFGWKGVLDPSANAIDRQLDVAVSVSNLASVPPLVARTDFIAVVPRRLAEIGDNEQLVAKFALPIEVPGVEAKLIWGRGTDRSPVATWFRDLVTRTSRRHGPQKFTE